MSDATISAIERIRRLDGTVVHRFWLSSGAVARNASLDCILLPKGSHTASLDEDWLLIQRKIGERWPSADFVWRIGVPKLLYLSDPERTLVEFAVTDHLIETPTVE